MKLLQLRVNRLKGFQCFTCGILNVCFYNPFNHPFNQPLVFYLFKQCRITEWEQRFSDVWLSRILYRTILSKNFAQQFIVFWVANIQVTNIGKCRLLQRLLFGCTIQPTKIILCSATNVAFAFSEWVRDKVVEVLQDCARVDIVTI